jgi:hypothetical protein
VVLAVTSIFVTPRSQPADVPDTRLILASHLSHGIGRDPFDSGVWRDELNARLIVSARSGATLEELQQIVPDRQDLAARLSTLEQDGFLRRQNDRVRAAFPIVMGKAPIS